MLMGNVDGKPAQDSKLKQRFTHYLSSQATFRGHQGNLLPAGKFEQKLYSQGTVQYFLPIHMEI